MKLLLSWACALAASIAGPAMAQGKPHVHGAAELDIAIEKSQITLGLEAPLDSLLGFERAPRGDGEKRRVETAVAALRAGESLFQFPIAAGCKLASVELVSPVLKLGPPSPAAADDGHADLDAEYVFTCADTARATEVDVGLFDSFIRMQRIQVEVVTGKGQFKRDLKRPARQVLLVR